MNCFARSKIPGCWTKEQCVLEGKKASSSEVCHNSILNKEWFDFYTESYPNTDHGIPKRYIQKFKQSFYLWMHNRKNTRTCKFNWNALTWREWMWNAIFIEAVFQTEDLLGNTIRSLEPHLITLKWGVTLFNNFFRSRKGDQVHFETMTTRLDQNSMIMSRDSSVIERYHACVQKKIGSGFDEELMDTKLQLENAALNFGRFFPKISRCDQHRNSLPTKMIKRILEPSAGSCS